MKDGEDTEDALVGPHVIAVVEDGIREIDSSGESA
jgi:hypothetical protein